MIIYFIIKYVPVSSQVSSSTLTSTALASGESLRLRLRLIFSTKTERISMLAVPLLGSFEAALITALVVSFD